MTMLKRGAHEKLFFYFYAIKRKWSEIAQKKAHFWYDAKFFHSLLRGDNFILLMRR